MWWQAHGLYHLAEYVQVMREPSRRWWKADSSDSLALSSTKYLSVGIHDMKAAYVSGLHDFAVAGLIWIVEASRTTPSRALHESRFQCLMPANYPLFS